MKNDSKKNGIKITDYFKLQPYEKKPFYFYLLFLLILVPIFIIQDQNSVVIVAFAVSLITTSISFWIIHDKRKGEIIGITVVIKEGKANVTIERYSYKNYPLPLKTTKKDEIINKISEEIAKIKRELEEKNKQTREKNEIPIKKLELTKEEIKEITEFKEDEENGKNTTKILSVLYGLVAALAITNALDFFIVPVSNLNLPFNITNVNFTTIDSLYEVNYLIISQEFILLISFFVVGTFFYHCGLAFFSDQASDMMNRRVPRPTYEVVLSGVILFTEGIFLYFAAGSIGSVLQFSLWIFFLMVVDVTWVLLNSIYLKRGYAQWIHFDIIMIIFFVVFLSYGDTELVQYYHYLIVFGVILCRIILDYKLSWQFFTKFSIVE